MPPRPQRPDRKPNGALALPLQVLHGGVPRPLPLEQALREPSILETQIDMPRRQRALHACFSCADDALAEAGDSARRAGDARPPVLVAALHAGGLVLDVVIRALGRRPVQRLGAHRRAQAAALVSALLRDVNLKQ